MVTVLAALPVGSASQGESYFFTPTQTFVLISEIYSKEPLLISEQIAKLESRGLIIENRGLAERYLRTVGYYRLAGYWWPLQSDKTNHVFKEGSTFDRVVKLYDFDSNLRMLIFQVLARIEISLRTKLIYHLSHEFGPWWFQNTNLFKDIPALIKSLEGLRVEVSRSKETFIKAHRKKYKQDGRFPPSWKALELSSFGTLSKLYGNLKPNVDSLDIIAKEYGAENHTYLKSWLQSLAQIRNFCAHHSRLWNKNLPGTVKILRKPKHEWIKNVPTTGEFQYLYIHLCIAKYMLNRIDPENDFGERFQNLMKKYLEVDHRALGLKSGWQNEPLWKY